MEDERKTEQTILKVVKQGLAQSVRELDLNTKQRLLRKRRLALKHRRHLSGCSNLVSFSPSMAVAAGIILVVILWLMPTITDSGLTVIPPLTNVEVEPKGMDTSTMEVLMSNEDLDFLENLDIYEWLDSEYG